MKQSMNTTVKFLGLAALLLISVWSCKDDDPPVTPDAPIASFQFVISADNFLEVTFTNFSKNSSSYSWNFGDGNASTDENPVHIYSAPGKYNVELTSSNGTTEAKKVEVVTVTDPDAALTLLAGTTSKTWYLQREGIALGIGPVAGDVGWWSFGGATPLGDRPCIIDDEYTFHRDGTWEFESNNTLFIDSEGNGGWLGPEASESCHDEDEPDLWTAIPGGEDVSSFGNGGDYSYAFISGESITLNGLGAYIGLANKGTSGDGNVPLPVDVKVYQLLTLSAGDIADTLKLSLITETNGAWTFYLVSYHDINDLPEIPTSLPDAKFDFTIEDKTVTFKNNSTNATSYSWDFGDGGMSTDKDPSHTYGADGEYPVKLTATDASSNMHDITKSVVISSAVYSPSVLSSADGKAWVLNGEASFKVGPAPGSGEWWGGIDAAGVAERPCQMDDEFIFFDNGTMVMDSKGEVWAEDYMGGANSCVADSNLTSPFELLASGMHMFTASNDIDPVYPSITAIGDGAHIGFSKPYNGGELDGMTAPKSQIKYDVIDYSKAGDTEILVIACDYSADQDGTAYWTITLRAK